MGDGALTDLLEDDAVRRIREVLADRQDTVVTLADAAGRLLWASTPGSQELFGRHPDALRGAVLFDDVHPDDVGRARRQFARALAGETVRYQVRARTVAGAWRRVTSVAWCVAGPWGDAVVTITTTDGPDTAWPSTVHR